MGGESLIWIDLFLRVFVEALGWCAAAGLVVAAFWSADRTFGHSCRHNRRAGHPGLPTCRSDGDYLGREPFGE